jgi:hypothetical protein
MSKTSVYPGKQKVIELFGNISGGVAGDDSRAALDSAANVYRQNKWTGKTLVVVDANDPITRGVVLEWVKSIPEAVAFFGLINKDSRLSGISGIVRSIFDDTMGCYVAQANSNDQRIVVFGDLAKMQGEERSWAFMPNLPPVLYAQLRAWTWSSKQVKDLGQQSILIQLDQNDHGLDCLIMTSVITEMICADISEMQEIEKNIARNKEINSGIRSRKRYNYDSGYNSLSRGLI